ncbi:MAG: spore coat protein [Eubacteriales bacterium]|nr:spore coat protein [Eubacteriales bacterium]MDD4422468.1 spore coat protein [Eubacteriales bacterium]HBR32065.1 spore coat protein [Clostridiales bacterium]
MDDKSLMESLLITVKGASGIYYHGMVESSTANVRNTFDNALSKTLQMQNDIFCRMRDKGWYQTQPVDQKQITQTAQKFAQMQ